MVSHPSKQGAHATSIGWGPEAPPQCMHGGTPDARAWYKGLMIQSPYLTAIMMAGPLSWKDTHQTQNYEEVAAAPHLKTFLGLRPHALACLQLDRKEASWLSHGRGSSGGSLTRVTEACFSPAAARVRKGKVSGQQQSETSRNAAPGE